MYLKESRVIFISGIVFIAILALYLCISNLLRKNHFEVYASIEPYQYSSPNIDDDNMLYGHVVIESYKSFQQRFEKHFYKSCFDNLNTLVANYIDIERINGRSFLYEYRFVYTEGDLQEKEYSSEQFYAQVKCGLDKAIEDHNMMLAHLNRNDSGEKSRLGVLGSVPKYTALNIGIKNGRGNKNLIHALIVSLIAGLVAYSTLQQNNQKRGG